jgi:hypothetical protein
MQQLGFYGHFASLRTFLDNLAKCSVLNGKGRALAQFTADFDSAAHLLNDLLADAQPEAHSLGILAFGDF